MVVLQAVDITEIAVLGEQFPLRLMQLGFRLMQVADAQGWDRFRYVVPPLSVVPAGLLLMGSDRQQDPDAQDNELPQQMVPVGAFAIGTYPLTVEEYACFVQATNYAVPTGWRYQWSMADHPVQDNTWFAAKAYVRWLAKATGEGWRLPTEAEWEKAARGTDGRIYPWGNTWDPTRAMTLDRALRPTTPVGSYPRGASPYGVQDLVGTRWEWTSTTEDHYPYQANDGRNDRHQRTNRVLRGGAFGSFPVRARAACRFSLHPTKTSYLTGGRLVRGDVAG
jgi:toxoflavin biosynthesis protein ToxD